MTRPPVPSAETPSVRVIHGRPPEPLLSAWQEWFRHHGIDPVYVPTSNTIERRPAKIVCDMYDLHEDGNGVRFTTGTIVKRQVFTLDGHPLPFPDVPAELSKEPPC